MSIKALAHLCEDIPGKIGPMTNAAIDRVRVLEEHNLRRPQVDIATHHLIHAGLYARTIRIPAGVLLTGVVIKRATLLILHGDAHITMGDGSGHHLVGYHVIPASAHRKQAILAIEDTHLTMLFASQADSVLAAEGEFTDEGERLFSRTGENVVNITGE